MCRYCEYYLSTLLFIFNCLFSRGLGGKFGDEVMEKFKAKTMDDLSNLSKQQFISNFGEKSG